MEFLLDVGLPLSLAFIMFSLGIGLQIADFRRVATRKKPFFIGAFCQVLLLPLVALAIVLTFGLTGETAVGFMLLSFCPGGVTSNVVSRLARGDVALSVSLTAVVSLMAIVTVPLLVAWSVGAFMGAEAPEVSVTSLAIAMFLITALPVVLGMVLKGMAPTLVMRIEDTVLRIATALFALIIIAALLANWDAFIANVGHLGPATCVLVVVMLSLGMVLAKMGGLTWQEQKTVAIEAGIQNGTLGVTLAPLIVGTAVALPEMALPSAIYGIAMYAISLPFVFIVRGRGDG